MNEILLNGVAIRFRTQTFGAPSDAAVLLLPGANASGAWWPDEFCQRLADGGRYIIRYHPRHTEPSTTSPLGHDEYSVEDLADDPVRVLDGHRIARAHLVGMSFGGVLGQLVALKHHARVATLTLISSEPLASTAADRHPADQKKWADRLHEINAPSLIVHGTHDSVVPYSNALVLESALRQTTLLTLDGTGHELRRDDWTAVIGAILRHTASAPTNRDTSLRSRMRRALQSSNSEDAYLRGVTPVLRDYPYPASWPRR